MVRNHFHGLISTHKKQNGLVVKNILFLSIFLIFLSFGLFYWINLRWSQTSYSTDGSFKYLAVGFNASVCNSKNKSSEIRMEFKTTIWFWMISFLLQLNWKNGNLAQFQWKRWSFKCYYMKLMLICHKKSTIIFPSISLISHVINAANICLNPIVK